MVGKSYRLLCYVFIYKQIKYRFLFSSTLRSNIQIEHLIKYYKIHFYEKGLFQIILINSRALTFNWNAVYCTLASLQSSVQFNKYKDEYVLCVSVKMFTLYTPCSNTFALLPNLDYLRLQYLTPFIASKLFSYVLIWLVFANTSQFVMRKQFGNSLYRSIVLLFQ